MSDYPEPDREVLAAGIEWLYRTVQPEGAIIQHHGTSISNGEKRGYGFCPDGALSLPVISVNAAGWSWEGVGPRRRLIGGLAPGEMAANASALADLGLKIREHWNGDGATTGSFGLAQPAHPSLLAAVNRYLAGCPVHGTVFCGWQGSTLPSSMRMRSWSHAGLVWQFHFSRAFAPVPLMLISKASCLPQTGQRARQWTPTRSPFSARHQWSSMHSVSVKPSGHATSGQPACAQRDQKCPRVIMTALLSLECAPGPVCREKSAGPGAFLWLLLVAQPAVSAGPLLDFSAPPDLAHLEPDYRLGKVTPGYELLDALPADPEHVFDLGGAYEVMHDSDHSQESTSRLTRGQCVRETSHMTSSATVAVQVAPTPLIGRCVICKRAFRVSIPSGIQVFPAAPGGAIRAAGIGPVWCDCRDGVRCAESPLGLPACGDSFCSGHPQGFVRFAAVRVTYKAEKACGGSCWSAKSSNCTCSCDGENHGGMWARW